MQCKRMVSIAHQGKSQPLFRRKRGIFLNRVEACPEHYHIVLVEVAPMVAKAARLSSAAGRTGFGKEPDEHLMPTEIAERYRLPLMRGQSKFRRGFTHLKHDGIPPTTLNHTLCRGSIWLVLTTALFSTNS